MRLNYDEKTLRRVRVIINKICDLYGYKDLK
jgi:hypothetical protein